MIATVGVPCAASSYIENRERMAMCDFGALRVLTREERVKGRQTGRFKQGGLSIWAFLFLFCFFGTFPIFQGVSRFVRGLSGDFPNLSFSCFSAYLQHVRATVPKGSATQSGPFPKKVGNPPLWKPPALPSREREKRLHHVQQHRGV